MSITNFYLPLNQGNTQKQDTRTRPSKYAQSPIRDWRFEQSEGVRPAEYMGVYKHLPVAFQDINTEDWVVIPKGRIVSAVGAFNATPVSGIVHPMSSGSIKIGNAGDYMGTGTGAVIEAGIDTSYFGYDEHIVQLLVWANGGSGTFNYYYSSDDVTAKTRAATTALATASGAFSLPANIPIGVAFTDIYQDIRGQYLNYRMHEDGYHVLTDWFVEVPFVDYKDAGFASGCNPAAASWGTTVTVGTYATWRAVNKQFTYLAFDSGTDTVTPGALVCSDGIGNYKLQVQPTFTTTVASGSHLIGTVTTVSNPAYTRYNMPRTPQTVGKLFSLDTRIPKDNLEDVLTYPRSGMPGSQTAGVTKNLFDFAYYCLLIGKGSAQSVETVQYAIRAGLFGLARIQLLVS